MPQCIACGTVTANRWFFFKSPAGVVSACSHTCREVYLSGIDDEAAAAEFEEARATLRLNGGLEPGTDSPPH